MLRYCVVLAVSLLAVQTASASWADKMFDELSKDFGSVPRGPMLKHYFKVTNNTKETGHDLQRPGVVRLHQRDRPQVVFETRQGNAHLRHDGHDPVRRSQDRDDFRAVFHAQFRGSAALGPGQRPQRFRRCPRYSGDGFDQARQQPKHAVVVTFYGMPDTKITEVKTESNYIQTEVKAIKTEGGEAAFELKASLRSDTPTGKWYSDVWLKTNNPSIPQLRVPLTVEVESALSVSPDLVSIGQLKVEAESERRVVIRGAQPFKITEIEGTDDVLSVKDSTEEAKPIHVLTVKFKPTASGELKRKIKVKTDLKEENVIDFQVTATVMP